MVEEQTNPMPAGGRIAGSTAEGSCGAVILQRPINIGITTTVAMISGGGLWTSGMGQNILYLAMLFRRLSFAQPSFIIAEATESGSIDGYPVVVADQETLASFDIILEVGIRLDEGLMSRFREGGGKLVSYMAGNAMVMNLEAVASGRVIGEVISELGFDAVWMTPQHTHMNRSYCALTRSPNVAEAPHIWHPSVLARAMDNFGANQFFWKERGQPNGWRIGVFDPTINVVKTFHLPLLACENTERSHPDLLASILLFSAARFKGNPHFEELVAALDIGRKGKVFAEERYALPQVLGTHIDAVVTHQWENNLNYLYWDVIYSGRPFVHNVASISDVGYYYKDFDPVDGGRVLADALAHHSQRREKARAGELEALWTFSIDNPKVQNQYAELIFDVMETSA